MMSLEEYGPGLLWCGSRMLKTQAPPFSRLPHPVPVAGQLRTRSCYRSSRHWSTFEVGMMGKGRASAIFRKARTVSKNLLGFCFSLSDLCLRAHLATEEPGR